jgi:PAS domain S-box-containing protein
VLAMFAAVLCWRIVSLVETLRWTDRADAVIAQANYTLRLAIDAETGERGYLVTDNPIFLQPYNLSRGRMPTAFNRLAFDARRTPDQVVRVNALRRQYMIWLTQCNKEIALEKISPARAKQVLNEGHVKLLMDQLRAQFDQFITIETDMRTYRAQNTNRATWQTLAVCIVLSLICGVLLGTYSLIRNRQFAESYENALRLSQRNRELLSATLFGIGDAVLVTDASAKVLMMNTVAETLTGWTMKEALNQSASLVFNIVNEGTRQSVESPIDRVLTDGVIVGLANHTVLLRRDGTEVPIDDSGAPIRDDQKNLIGVVLVFRDISERKIVELERAEAYEREHRIAEDLQRALIRRPTGQFIPEIVVETLYQPALAEAKVGGDFFDIFQIDNHTVALIVGDVSGKGLEAASRTAEMKFALRTYLFESRNLAVALTKFNCFVHHSQSTSKDYESFLCLTAALVDTAACTAEFCAAGSEEPLILSSEGIVKSIPVHGTPIGVDGEYTYIEQVVSLSKGDTIVLATDGITESRSNGEFLGNDGFAKILEEIGPALPLDKTVNSVITRIAEFTDNRFADDICVLMARIV